MPAKDIIIGVLIGVNIISNSLIIYSSGNILPNKDENNTKTNTTNLYIQNFKNNLTISNTNSSNPNEIKKFGIFPTYNMSDVTRFFNKAHKGLYFIPIFAFLFIALLFISYFVEEEPGGENPLHGCSPSNMQGSPAAAGIFLIAIFLFVFVLLILLAAAIGKKASRIAGAFLHMIFSLICVILGAVQGNNDGIKTYVLITIIVGSIAAFYNLVAAIAMFFDDCDCDCSRSPKNKSEDINFNNNYSNLSKNDNNKQDDKPNKSDIETTAPLAAELKTVSSNNDNNDGNIEGKLVLNPTPE